MGQTNSTITNNADLNQEARYQDLVKNYQFLRKIKDLRYGEVYLLQDNTSKEIVALREIVSKNAQDFEREMNSLKTRAKVLHTNIVKIKDFASKIESAFGATINKIMIIMEFLENDLEREIKYKKTKSDFFSEEELWAIIGNVVKAFAMLQRNKITHEDLKPNSILISSTGTHKISQPNLADNSISAYNQLLNGSNDGKTYLSPTLLTNLQAAKTRPNHDPWKSDVFTLGMIVLQAATLTSCDKLYNWVDYTINYDELEQKLSSLRALYNVKLIKFVRSMLTVQEDKRPSFLALDELLSERASSSKNFTQTQANSALKPLISQNNDYNYDNRRYSSQRQDSKGIPVKIPQESQPNVPKILGSPIARNSAINYTPYKVQPTFQQEQSSSKPSSKNSLTEIKNLQTQERTKLYLSIEPSVTRASPTLQKQEFLSKTITKGKMSLGRGPSPNPPQTLSLNSEYTERQLTCETEHPHSINTLTSLHKTENIMTMGSLNEIKPKGSHSSHHSRKSGQYRTLISSEVVQLISDFKEKMERQRSPVNGNSAGLTSLSSCKDILITSTDITSKRILNKKTLENLNAVPLKTAENLTSYEQKQFEPKEFYSARKLENPAASHRSPHISHRSPEPTVRRDYKTPLLEVNNNVQRVRASQSPFYTQVQVNHYQPLENWRGMRKENNVMAQSWNVTSPKTVNLVEMEKGNNFYLLNNYLNSKGKSNNNLNEGYNVSATFDRQDQENMKTSFDANRKNLSYQTVPSQKIRMQDQVYQTKNLNNSNPSLTSLDKYPTQTQNQSTGRVFDPYMLFNRAVDQNITQKSPVLYEGVDIMKPKESIKTGSAKEFLPTKPQMPISNEGEIVSEKFEDGSIYKGQKKNGLRHGKGTYFHVDGGMYTGDWYEGAMEGNGTLYYSSGPKAYRGQWKADKFNGKGSVYNEAPAKLATDFDFTNFDKVGEYWVKYEGEFYNDNKEGQGVLQFTNGERFEGQFRDDMVEGSGTFYTKSGKAFRGEWWQNKLVRLL